MAASEARNCAKAAGKAKQMHDANILKFSGLSMSVSSVATNQTLPLHTLILGEPFSKELFSGGPLLLKADGVWLEWATPDAETDPQEHENG